MAMSKPGTGDTKRSRGAYSRLICLGCRERRIRCELPSEVEIPEPGEFRTVQAPCYRCKRLGVPCIVRQTILGRPGPVVAYTQPITVQEEAQAVSNSIISRNGSSSSHHVPPSQSDLIYSNRNTLLIHTPQSTETIITIHAADILRYEQVEHEWFRHLPAHVGHTQALDLSIKALVAACAYARGVPRLTSDHCYQALAVALNALQVNIKQSNGELNDDVLASTALLTPFEGVLKKHGIPTCLHVEGLAAILTARPATYPVTQLAREIFDFYICDSAIISCIQSTPSPFESVSRAYFDDNGIGYGDSDQARLKAFGSELFIRIPRLVGLVRSLRLSPSPQNQLLLDALELSKSLLRLHDSQAEKRLIQNVKINPSSNPDATSPIRQTLNFASIYDFEALTYYWQNRLLLLRLERHLNGLSMSNDFETYNANEPGISFRPAFGPSSNEMFGLVKKILMCTEYVERLPLRKHNHLFAHAIINVWGVMMDVPVAISDITVGARISPLSKLLLRRVSNALETKLDLTVEDMNIAADIFVGGWPKGRFVELFNL